MTAKPKPPAPPPNPHLVRSLTRTRRWLGGSFGMVATVGAGAGMLVLETRALAGSTSAIEWAAAVGLTALSSLYVGRVAATIWPARLRSEADPLAPMLDLDHALALQVAAHGVGHLAFGGGTDGFWCTVLATMLTGSLAQRGTAIVSVSVAIALEVVPSCLAVLPGSSAHAPPHTKPRPDAPGSSVPKELPRLARAPTQWFPHPLCNRRDAHVNSLVPMDRRSKSP